MLDLADSSGSSKKHMFDPNWWEGEDLSGWPEKSGNYYHFVPFGGSTTCTNAEIPEGTSYSQTLFASTGNVEKEDVESVHTEDTINSALDSIDIKGGTSFVLPQSAHKGARPVAEWEQMDKASQARLTAFYELHEMERGDKDDVKLWKDISDIILDGKHEGSIKCKEMELNFSCCRVRETETGDMCQALVVAKSSSRMWKEGLGVQCRRCQSQIGYTVYKARQKERHGFVKKKCKRKPY